MLRSCTNRGAKLFASTCQHTHLLSFHIQASQCAEATQSQKSRIAKKVIPTKKKDWQQATTAKGPSVVLGTRPEEEEQKWRNCYLAKLLVDEEELVKTTELVRTRHSIGEVDIPRQMGFGFGKTERNFFFEGLPYLSSQVLDMRRPTHFTIKTVDNQAVGSHNHDPFRDNNNNSELPSAPSSDAENPAVDTPEIYSESRNDPEELMDAGATANQRELFKANAFAKILDLRNASAGGISYENRRRIILAFSEPTNPYDTGRSEVQAALLTYQIRHLWSHLTRYKKDVANRRSLRHLVHKRAKVLKYLKGLDRNRYDTVLEQLALEPESVEGELVV